MYETSYNELLLLNQDKAIHQKHPDFLEWEQSRPS